MSQSVEPFDQNGKGEQKTKQQSATTTRAQALAGWILAIGLALYFVFTNSLVTKLFSGHDPIKNIGGSILDAETQKAVPGVHLWIEDVPGHETYSDDIGGYEFPVGDAFKKDQRVTLHAQKDGYDDSRHIAVVNGPDVPFRLNPQHRELTTDRPKDQSSPGSPPEGGQFNSDAGVVTIGAGNPACLLYGSADPGGVAWNKDDQCIIPAVNNLDTSYRQSDFNCCGGGATSPTTSAQIPPGLELRVTGYHYWSVINPILTGNIFRIHTYCGPEPPPGPGCNVSVEVIPHYKAKAG